MAEADGYLSRNRPYLARLQRQRRASMARIDYYPGADALAILEAYKAQEPGATNGAVLDAILYEWAELAGISYGEVRSAKTSAPVPQPAQARMTSTPWQATRRVICGARRHRDGQPCQARSEPGKRRCRFHGGRSTGPKTPEGKARALANLRQNRPK